MKISLIIPVYNVEPYLRNCLDTVVNQTYDSFEVIIVDDGSTDNGYAICAEYAQRYDNIILHHKENGGLISAWTCGLKLATGDYIAFLDSDDWVEWDYLEKLASGASEGADVVCCNRVLEYEGSRIFSAEDIAPGIYGKQEMKERIFPCLLNNGTYLGRGITPNRWGKLFRKSILDANLQYSDPRISYGEDLNIVFPVMLDCEMLVVLDDKKGLYHYRQNRKSIVRAYKKQMFQQIQRLYRKLQQAIQDKDKSFMLEQLRGDYLCVFLEYLKNETAGKRPLRIAAKEIVENYQCVNREMDGIRIPDIRLKKSDAIALRLLEGKSVTGLAFWMWLYIAGKRCLGGRDWKYLFKKNAVEG